jgi:hypothetical protein
MLSASQEVNNYFIEDRFATNQFEVELQQLLTVLAPIAKAITCLESTHSNVSDVYLFWLAVTATIHQIITEDITGLPIHVTEEIRQAVNYRFNQMVNDAPCDVYLTGFILDPRKFFYENRVLILLIDGVQRVQRSRYPPGLESTCHCSYQNRRPDTGSKFPGH